MPEKNNKKGLSKNLSKCKKEIIELRLRLNQLDNQKEEWFKKKEKVSNDLSNLFKKIKELKNSRNSLTRKVKELKTKRENYNKLIKDKIVEIKKVNNDKKNIINKFKIKEDPSQIKHDIEKLETKIETEVMSFDKEQKLMKEIKLKKKQYKGSEKVSGVWQKSNSLSKEIDKLKKDADEAHKNIKINADESQKKHEEMMKSLNDVDDLKKMEDSAYKKFFEFKKELSNTNNLLKIKLVQINELNKSLGLSKEKTKKEKKQKEEKIIKEKQVDVEEKIKKGKKLTTEDLLVFQRLDNQKSES